MAEPTEGQPDYWPERPEDAYWSNGGVLNSKRGWTVPHMPPEPWPHFPGMPPRDVYGPAGTRWLYFSDDLLDRLHLGFSDVLTAAFQFMLKAIKRRFLAPATRYTWTVPGPREADLMSVQAIRTSIHANLQGSEEELVHVLHWLPGAGPAPDSAGLVDFATTVQDQWHSAFGDISGVFYTGTVYDYVAAALITFDPPDDPSYDVLTEYVNFAAVTAGTGPSACPNEVAMCVSHTTARRGARYRGRTYLGGLATVTLEPNGRFKGSYITSVRDAWIAFIDGVMINTGSTFVVLSGKFGTAEAVTGERVGDVPDSMRSRRKSQTEAYVAAPLAD